MKEYVCVTSRYFEDGTTDVKITVSERKMKPENKVVHRNGVDMYIDWYDSMKDALIAAAGCRKISKKSYTAERTQEKAAKTKEW